MFLNIHLFSQDSPDGADDFRFRPHPYLRMDGSVPKGPATFKWTERQLEDLEELWVNPDAEGPRERLAKDLAAFAEKLGWVPDADKFEEAEECGEEALVTVRSAAQELFMLPWEIIHMGAADCYLADFSSSLVRYCVPGLGVREVMDAPPNPGVLFGWSAAGGAVPHEEQGQAIRNACEAAGTSFKEISDIDEASLQAALDDNPPSVLHLLCHGMPGPEGEPPRLNWGPSDNARTVTATRLARMLRRSKKSIRLVVLSACGSGDSQQDVMFMSSLAQELHKKGIPNVIASRYPLSVRGSKVLVQQFYEKLLTEAWSLERSLRHTREQLFKADADGKSYSGDAYGMQLYAYDTEKFVSANGVEAERPVLATYVFGTAEQPTPASLPPRKDTEITFEVSKKELDAGKDALLEKLKKHAEDESLTFEVKDGTGTSKGLVPLAVETTVDGAQRLVASWRSGELEEDTGFKVLGVKVAKAIKAPLAVATGGIQAGKALGLSGVLMKKSASTAAKTSAKAAASTGKSAAAAAGKGVAVKALAGVVAAGVVVGGGVIVSQKMGDSSRKDETTLVTTFDAGPAPTPDIVPVDAPVAVPVDAPVAVPVDAATASSPVVTKPAKPVPDPVVTKPAATVPTAYLDEAGIKGSKIRITWSVPRGAAGVLVVASNDAPIKGTPKNGKIYAVGSEWRPGKGKGKIVSFGTNNTYVGSSASGQVTYVAVWAFNKDHVYGRMDAIRFVHP